MAEELFAAHGVAPAKRVEADHEAVISSLVVAGLGVALMREDVALEARRRQRRVPLARRSRRDDAVSSFTCDERESDPVVRALTEVVRDIWTEPSEATPRAAA